ncbi:MAG: stalk domain-containing protein [Bacillota bacterium]
MKPSKAIIIVLVLVMFTSVSWAASINGDYKGFPIVKVTLNGKPVTSSVPATNFYGSTVLPVRAVAESLGTVVNWDAKTATANLMKINANMILAESVDWKNDAYVITNVWTSVFIAEDYYYDFDVFYDSDMLPEGLLKGKYAIRTVICDSNKDVIYTSMESTFNADEEDGFWGVSEYRNVVFPKVGDYTLEFQMKSEGGTYQTMDKRTLNAIAE